MFRLGLLTKLALVVIQQSLEFLDPFLLRVDINTSIEKESLETEKFSWEMMLECSEQEPYAVEFRDLLAKRI